MAGEEHRTAELLAESLTSLNFEEQHHYRITRYLSEDFSFGKDTEYMIPDAYFIDFDYADSEDPYSCFEQDGGKFINDIYGIEPDTYIDTPDNRKIIIDYLQYHPEAIHGYFSYDDGKYDNAAWEQYNESFKDAKNCHFFAELKPSSLEESEMISKLCKMTGKQAYDAYGVNRDEVITNTVSFPNGVEIDVKLVICDEDEENWCEAVAFKNGNQVGAISDLSDDYFGQWEVFDRDGNQYHIQVSPVMEKVQENIKEAEKESAKEEKRAYAYFELPNDELARNKRLMDISGEHAYKQYRLQPNRVFGYQAKFSDGYRMNISVVIEEGEHRNWSKAVLLNKQGETIDETGAMYSFDQWSLNFPGRYSYTAIAAGESKKNKREYIPDAPHEEEDEIKGNVVHVKFSEPNTFEEIKEKSSPKDVADAVVKSLTDMGFTQKEIDKILKELDRIRKNSNDMAR